MDVNRIWVLIGKKLTGNATPEDIAELDSLMAGRIDTMYPIRELENAWRAINGQSNIKSPSEVNAKWKQFKNKLPAETSVIPVRSQKRNAWLWLAASVFIIIVAAVGLTISDNNYKTNLLTTIIEAPAGSTSQVILPDGSKVWLNAKSKLVYKKHFGEKFREVSLVGEAFFDVVKDPQHPFIVNTSSLHLKVLGTAFNVRSFANDKTSEAALVRGSIEVTLVNNPDTKITLKPSQKIIVRNVIDDIVAKPVVPNVSNNNNTTIKDIPLITLSTIRYKEAEPLPEEIQWIEKKLVFTSENFDDLAMRMERYYNVTIEFEDETAKDIVLSGSFKEENINEAMKALQLTGNFKYKTANNKITIYK
jgi:ferric-dicitrate binding protein FerR (iron transport regulator)